MFTSIDVGEGTVTKDAKLSSSTVEANRLFLGLPHHETTCSREMWRKMTSQPRELKVITSGEKEVGREASLFLRSIAGLFK